MEAPENLRKSSSVAGPVREKKAEDRGNLLSMMRSNMKKSSTALLLVMLLSVALKRTEAFGGMPAHRFGTNKHHLQRPFRLPLCMTASGDSTSSSFSTSSSDAPSAHDGEALQALFNTQCDKDGLMTKQMLAQVPAIQELLVRISLRWVVYSFDP